MIPYVACMIVVIGMVAHFLITVTRFVGRREAEEMAAGDVIRAEAGRASDTAAARKGKRPAAKTLRRLRLVAGRPAGAGRRGCSRSCRWLAPPAAAAKARRKWTWSASASLPVAHLGRIKPLDTLARNTLRAISQPRIRQARGRQADSRRRSGCWK